MFVFFCLTMRVACHCALFLCLVCVRETGCVHLRQDQAVHGRSVGRSGAGQRSAGSARYRNLNGSESFHVCAPIFFLLPCHLVARGSHLTLPCTLGLREQTV